MVTQEQMVKEAMEDVRQCRRGKYKLTYDKASRTIVAVRRLKATTDGAK